MIFLIFFELYSLISPFLYKSSPVNLEMELSSLSLSCYNLGSSSQKLIFQSALVYCTSRWNDSGLFSLKELKNLLVAVRLSLCFFRFFWNPKKFSTGTKASILSFVFFNFLNLAFSKIQENFTYSGESLKIFQWSYECFWSWMSNGWVFLPKLNLKWHFSPIFGL